MPTRVGQHAEQCRHADTEPVLQGCKWGLPQVCRGRKSLFQDRLYLNMLCDLPAAFISKLQKLAETPLGAQEEPCAEPCTTEMLPDAADLETPRGPAEEEAFDEFMDMAPSSKQARAATLTCGELPLPRVSMPGLLGYFALLQQASCVPTVGLI